MATVSKKAAKNIKASLRNARARRVKELEAVRAARPLPLMPFNLSLYSALFEATVVSAANEHGVREIIFQGNLKTAEFVRDACNAAGTKLKLKKGVA